MAHHHCQNKITAPTQGQAQASSASVDERTTVSLKQVTETSLAYGLICLLNFLGQQLCLFKEKKGQLIMGLY